MVYYAKNPATQLLERFRICVPACKVRSERLKMGKIIVQEINTKLADGWLPFYDTINTEDFKTFEFCAAEFLKQTETQVARGEKRYDTLKSYKSNINLINLYKKEKNAKLFLCLDINKPFVTKYLDWIYYERKNSTISYNNRLAFMNLFMNYCVNHGYHQLNFCNTIPTKKNAPKKRKVLTPEVKQKLNEYRENNPSYFALCMITYFCFVRRTELTKIKVADVNLQQNFITIDHTISKNKKTDCVTIPVAFSPILLQHIAGAKKTDYLFSANNFLTGTKKLEPKKVSDDWLKFRRIKKVSNEFDFYSLKDTGITDLLNSGIPAIKVRDQARHHDLKITESYTNRNTSCDDVVRNSDFKF